MLETEIRFSYPLFPSFSPTAGRAGNGLRPNPLPGRVHPRRSGHENQPHRGPRPGKSRVSAKIESTCAGSTWGEETVKTSH